MKEIVFLIGAGNSQACGLPGTNELTNRILKEKYYFDTSERVIKGPPSKYSSNKVGLCQEVLKYIKRWLKRNFKQALKDSGNTVTYEDLYFIIDQIANYGEHENPLILPFYKRLGKWWSKSERYKKYDTYGNDTTADMKELDKCLYSIIGFIKGAVAVELGKKNNFAGYKYLLDVLHNQKIKVSGIITLNHDILIEKVLEQNKINFIDGFDEKGNYKIWPFEEKGRYLIKLHGSINWYYDENGDHLTKKEQRYGSGPEILIGTHNKMFNYIRAYYLSNICKAYELFKRADVLVSIGYGFRDKGVNNMIIAATQIGKEHKKPIIIVDKNKKLLKESARFAAQKNIIEGAFLIEKLAEDLTGSDIYEKIKEIKQHLPNQREI